MSPVLASQIYVAVLDFSGTSGGQLADSIRLRLGRAENISAVDSMTIREFFDPAPADCDPTALQKLLKEKLACTAAIYGTVTRDNNTYSARAVCVEVDGDSVRTVFDETFSDNSQRWRAVISRQIAEKFTNQPEWTPPQYGDEPIPSDPGKPVNLNGGFEKGTDGWEKPDLASTFLTRTDTTRQTVLKVLTNLNRDRWLEYKRDLLLGKTTPANAPKIETDTTYASLAGLEGVHFSSEWIPAKPNSRYVLTAECKSPAYTGLAFPKVFIKGYLDWSHKAQGLPERSLAELGLTPGQFANLDRTRQKELIKTDALKHPDRYRRECYRWYLACRNPQGKWEKYQAIFPPRGGLPENVKWLKIQIYSYWPPGEYLWDNVNLYNLTQNPPKELNK